MIRLSFEKLTFFAGLKSLQRHILKLFVPRSGTLISWPQFKMKDLQVRFDWSEWQDRSVKYYFLFKE